MEHKFKAGDKVVCVDNDGAESLCLGKEYTIDRLRGGPYGEGALYLSAHGASWLAKRFVLAGAQEAGPEAPVPSEDYHARKFDKGKPRIGLIPGECLEGIGEVLEYGARKYAKDSWKEVPDAEERYLDALGRHFKEILKHGLRAVDEESGKLHIDHLTTNGAFLQYFARKT